MAAKSLGVFVDVDKVLQKVAACIGAIKRTKPFVPHSTLLTIFNSLVQPLFDYCNVVWGNSRKGSCDKLQKLQYHANQFILSTYR